MDNNIIWKDVYIDGTLSNYMISNDGQIYSKISNKILSPFINKDGYLLIHLHHNTKSVNKSVHRLVAIAFIPNPENKPQVNHKDGNKLNNKVENLEWCTNSENMQHAYITGLKHNPHGSDSVLSKYTDKQIHLVCKLLENKVPMKLISILTKVRYKKVNAIKLYREWKHIALQYNIDSNYDSETSVVKKIKYKKLKSILMGLNSFDNIDLSDLLYSKYIIKKKKLIEDLELLGYEIFIDSKLYKELSDNGNEYIK